MPTNPSVRYFDLGQIRLLLPILLPVLVLSVAPLVQGVYLGFTDYRLGEDVDFNGLQNYSYMLEDRFFWQSFKIGAVWTVAVTAGQIVLGLGLTGYLLPWDQKGYWATSVGTNLASQAPLVVPDAREHALLRDNPAIQDYDIIAYAGVPLRGPDGSVLGSFCAIDGEPHAWTDADVAALHGPALAAGLSALDALFNCGFSGTADLLASSRAQGDGRTA